jgi:hypothetical protein
MADRDVETAASRVKEGGWKDDCDRKEGTTAAMRALLKEEDVRWRGEEGWEISEWMMGAEESRWSERRARALFKYIFRIEWA